jgi:PIN domain nuclease of toxin-antitoxin system
MQAIATREIGEAAVSAVSLYEIANALRRGRVQTTRSADDVLRGEIMSRFVVRPISPEIALKAITFESPYPRDPMDRIIGATALVEGMELVTADAAIRGAGVVPVIW